MVTLSARFSARGVALGVGVALALAFAVAWGTDHQAIVDNPVLLVAPLTLITCTAILSTALMQSDVHHRSETVIDPLTGMLNRKALATRVAELEQQSQVSGEPIGLVVGDLDHFKEVNDSCGHTTGDAVLKEVAYEMRKELRAFDLAYRLGGEEFLVVLPGADAQQAERLAERLREIIAGVEFSGDQRADHELRRERVAARRALRVPARVRRGRHGAVRGQALRARPCLPRGRGAGAGPRLAAQGRPPRRRISASWTTPRSGPPRSPRSRRRRVSACSPRPRRPGTTSATRRTCRT